MIFEIIFIILCIALFVYYAFVAIAFFQSCFDTKSDLFIALIPFGLLGMIARDIYKDLE